MSKSRTTLTIESMIEDLKKHHRNTNKLKMDYIQTRLDKSLKSYYEELMSTFRMLTRKEATKVLKKMVNEGDK